jgi:hypothetical protein
MQGIAVLCAMRPAEDKPSTLSQAALVALVMVVQVSTTS